MRKWHCSKMPVPMKPASSLSGPQASRAAARHTSHPSVQLSMSGAWTVSRQRVTSGHTARPSVVTGMGPGAPPGQLMVVPHRSLLTVPRLRLPRR